MTDLIDSGSAGSDPHAGEDGFYDGYGNWIPGGNTNATQTVGSLTGPGTVQTSDVTGMSIPQYSVLFEGAQALGLGQGPYQLTPEQQAQIEEWNAESQRLNEGYRQAPQAKIVEDSTIDDGGGDSRPPLPPLPPAGPPRPPDITGQAPTAAPNRAAVFGQGGGNDGGNVNQSFASLIPRVAGNSSPRDVTGATPSVPAWARGLMRSPYARHAQRGSQGAFAAMPGFSPEVPIDEEQQMMQESALPAWMAPGA